MKNILFILALCFLGFAPPVSEYTFYQALSSSLVTAEIEVNTNSTHYHEPFKIKLKNISGRNLKIKLENGMKLEPGESEYQNFMIVQEQLISLAPNQREETKVRAMCLEAHDRAPSGGSDYHFSGRVNDKLKGLGRIIQANELYSYMGQDAVWAVADGKSAREISGYHYDEGLSLIRYVANLNGEELPPKPAADDYQRNYRAAVTKATVGGAFTFNASFPMAVEIALFNEDNTVVRELFNNEETPPGEHVVEYSFDHSVYTEDFYTVRMIADGELFLENRFSFNPEDWRNGN